jgi:hypothetical protein
MLSVVYILLYMWVPFSDICDIISNDLSVFIVYSSIFLCLHIAGTKAICTYIDHSHSGVKLNFEDVVDVSHEGLDADEVL